jgi:hypothetical protein
MSVQMCTCDTAVRLRDRISDLEVRLADVLARNERLEVEAAATTLRADELERELANERELRNVLEEAVEDRSIVATLERIIARHAAEMQDERARHATEVQEERARLDAATIRHEQAILDLVSRHRQEVSQRLDRVLDQNKTIFARISASLQDLWAARGTTRPSLDKEHWFILAQEEEEEEDGNKIVTFKIHSGQRSYIDRIGRDKDVLLASPAANGVDIRQSAKKRMLDLTANHEVCIVNHDSLSKTDLIARLLGR